ncbi:Aste57867_23549 [Aphanomyces stellatus]|uniref:Aste57867_23549 protein n=1 Tax=Aphanomyces stellatus TaxID=120398 RepID=A0A485LNT7_9STRA|nr:hypothetical protein As57867_023478 [Aphanomyces stellatus]VFU00194.1 Aste57867_23549 [Aphanomyces stellatus]
MSTASNAHPGLQNSDASQTAVQDNTVQLSIYVVLCVGCYVPFLLAIYYLNRDKPAIRYRNPVEMVVATSLAFLYGVCRCLNTLFQSSVNCTTSCVLAGIPMQLAFMAYLMAKLRVVLTFKLTELMVVHAENKSESDEALLTRLHTILRHKVYIKLWLTAQFFWNVPLAVLLLAMPYTDEVGQSCPLNVFHATVYLDCALFTTLVVLSLTLSYHLSRAVDNFGLRRAFTLTSRVLAALFCLAFPATYFSDTTFVREYALDLFTDLLMVHAFIFIHIGLPVLGVLYGDYNLNTRTYSGTSGILNAYLHTAEGYILFSEFAKLEFTYECVVAWKSIANYRVGAENHLSALEIYQQHVAESAPLPLHKALPAHVWKRYQVAFDATRKYSANPDDIHRARNYFDVLFDALVHHMVHETLPRFQKHALGGQWAAFVEQFVAQTALDQVLSDKENKNDVPSIRAKSYAGSRLQPIESRGESMRFSVIALPPSTDKDDDHGATSDQPTSVENTPATEY